MEGSNTEKWNKLIYEWMISKKEASVCGIATISDGAVFAGACMSGDPVDQLYKASYEVAMPQEDGSDKAVMVNEPGIIKFAAENLKAPQGLWIGGSKYKVVRCEDACDSGDFMFKTVFAPRPGGGCWLIITPKGFILIALYEEKLGQNSGSVKTALLAFAEFLAKNGY